MYVAGCSCEVAEVVVVSGRRDRIDDGRRKDGGRRPQFRGGLGGIVLRCGILDEFVMELRRYFLVMSGPSFNAKHHRCSHVMRLVLAEMI